MNLDIYQIDAFATTAFTGNPAAVCILGRWLPDFVMQAIAAEMNLSETAFVVKKGDEYRIRWFTPSTEVRLCGHATLASAHVLFNHHQVAKAPLRFRSLSGLLVASPGDDESIILDFPAAQPHPVALTTDIFDAVGGEPLEVLAADDLIVIYSDATEIGILTPDIPRLARLPYRGVCVTAPGNGNGYDFVCRFFAPACGIDEDPVTGSAFTELAPYYRNRLGKDHFSARQVSKRGGDVDIEIRDDRVMLSGKAVTIMKGTMYLK